MMIIKKFVKVFFFFFFNKNWENPFKRIIQILCPTVLELDVPFFFFFFLLS